MCSTFAVNKSVKCNQDITDTHEIKAVTWFLDYNTTLCLEHHKTTSTLYNSPQSLVMLHVTKLGRDDLFIQCI